MTDVLREPRQDRSRATRQRLLEAAIECLAEVGWSGSTVSVVAERAGVSPLDHDPEMPFIKAIDQIADELVPVAARG